MDTNRPREFGSQKLGGSDLAERALSKFSYEFLSLTGFCSDAVDALSQFLGWERRKGTARYGRMSDTMRATVSKFLCVIEGWKNKKLSHEPFEPTGL